MQLVHAFPSQDNDTAENVDNGRNCSPLFYFNPDHSSN